MIHFFSKPPRLDEISPKPYRIGFALDRVILGVDNIHHDVYVSPRVTASAARAIYHMMLRKTGADELLRSDSPATMKKERERFATDCHQVLSGAVHKAKAASEIQIDYLLQAALLKMLFQEIENQYERVLGRLEDEMRSHELSRTQDLSQSLKIKDHLSAVRQQRKQTLRAVGAELADLLVEVQRNGIFELREANFGKESVLPEAFYLNPLLHGDAARDDEFLLANYLLLSNRFEDADNYEQILVLIGNLLEQIDFGHLEGGGSESLPASGREAPEPSIVATWMMVPENIDILFDHVGSRKRYRAITADTGGKEARRHLGRRVKTQKKLLQFFFRRFRKAGLIDNIVAGTLVASVYREFCPPLVPRQVLQFLTEPKSRKRIQENLNRVRDFYGKSFGPGPLYKAARRVKKTSNSKKKALFLDFLKVFARYHRDRTNLTILKEAMNAIHLVTDEKLIALSRENRTLYDLLLSDEQAKEDRAIISHVVIKADVRGSTDLTYRMRAKGLNPASFFSLNLFDPITEILFDYDATKEFIEGDALILSIFEQEETPEGWYSVARACGLAIRILDIARQYNRTGQQHALPVLELGIGICYNKNAPAFLFDGGKRIMISPAINLADRLSGCHKRLRALLEAKNLPFNLYVFQTASDEEAAATVDDLSLRYNVNGIELSPEAFKKLSEEIDLKRFRVSVTGIGGETDTFFAGKIPTLTGKYVPLIIRQAPVFSVSPETFSILGKSSRTFFEVCTHPALYERIQKII